MKRGFRGVWDAFMFHAVIKKRARVPASDSFVARRIAGPGLASNYFYQVNIEICQNRILVKNSAVQMAAVFTLRSYLFGWD